MTGAVVIAPIVLVDGAEARRQVEAAEAKLKVIVQDKQTEAERRVKARSGVEERWIQGLLQYHGKYKIEAAAYEGIHGAYTAQPKDGQHGQRSKVFMNLTGPKTDSFAARLLDMLFPTDDRNWDIQPTPVPTLTARAERAAEEAAAMSEEANRAIEAGEAEMQANPQMAAQKIDAGLRMGALANEFAAAARQVRSREEEAKRRNDAMRQVMDDQLTECMYSAEARDVIMDGCKSGTGVMKGPIRNMRLRRRWVEAAATDPNTGAPVKRYVSEEVADPKPAFNRVSYWAFFPDPDAASVQDSADFYERHLMNDKQMRRLAKVPGFDKDAIRKLLQRGAQTTVPSYFQDLRSINDIDVDAKVKRFVVWEWYGSLSIEDVRDLCACLGMADMAADYQDVDPLTDIPVCMWFCDGEVLKFGDYHMDSAEPLYSTFCPKPDEASIWGYGIPYIINHPQRSYNAGWRMMIDNMGLSSMPQFIVDPLKLQPENGVWELAPGKVWLAVEGADMRDGREPLRVVHIDGHQAEAANLIKMSADGIDQVADFPLIAQGGEGPHTTKTYGGLSILSNNANVVLRRVVKSWDDNITVPNLSRLYDWNMQFNEREDIKGDFEVLARGSSVLLIREVQSQNLMVAVTQLSLNPIIRPLVEDKLPNTVRALYQSLMLNPAEHVATDEEWKVKQAKMAAQPLPPDPETVKIQGAMALQKQKHADDMEVEQLRHETQMMKLAETLNMSRDKLEAMLLNAREQRASNERKVAAEIAVESRQPPGARLA